MRAALILVLFLFVWGGLYTDVHARGVLPREDVSHGKMAFKYGKRSDWRRADAHARKIRHAPLKKAYRWYKLKHPNGGADFQALQRFIAANPDWPAMDALIHRTEEQLARLDTAKRQAWFAQRPPQFAEGKLYHAEMFLDGHDWQGKDKEKAAVNTAITQIRELFQSGQYNDALQQYITRKYASILRNEDYFAAADALYWTRDLHQAESLLNKLTRKQQHLFDARKRLIRSSYGVDSAIRRVPKELKDHPGLMYDRLYWRHKRRLHRGSQSLLKKAPDLVPHPYKWWKIRKYYVWEAIEEKRYKEAYRLLKNHGQTEGIGIAEAEWLAGWISYHYLNQPGQAYEHFYKLYHGVQYPISKARGAYWAARAAMKHGEEVIGKKWYVIAAEHPYTYYGHLAFQQIEPRKPVPLPTPPSFSGGEYRQFKQQELPQAALALYEVNEVTLAKRFIHQMIENRQEAKTQAMAAKLGYSMGRDDIAVKAAKEAFKYGTLLPEIGYPTVTFVPRKRIEKAMVMAIARQESQFKQSSQSHVGAVGLMQLMPATARQVSRQLRLRYSKSKLARDSNYNMQIGSAYLANMIAKYDGYLPLAIASYNAGPGRVQGWMKAFGDPRDKHVDPIHWVERIPITETRNYVQRVLENLQIYRYQMSGWNARSVNLKGDLYQ